MLKCKKRPKAFSFSAPFPLLLQFLTYSLKELALQQQCIEANNNANFVHTN